METLTFIAANALAISILAGLAMPILAARLILAFDKRAARLVLPSSAFAASRPATHPRRMRLSTQPRPALQYASAAWRQPAQSGMVPPGLASRWKGAHRLAISV